MYVDWDPETRYRGSWQGGDEYVLIGVHDVASGDRARIQRALLRTAVPDLVTWLRDAAVAPEGWRLLRHRCSWAWDDEHGVRTLRD